MKYLQSVQFMAAGTEKYRKNGQPDFQFGYSK